MLYEVITFMLAGAVGAFASGGNVVLWCGAVAVGIVCMAVTLGCVKRQADGLAGVTHYAAKLADGDFSVTAATSASDSELARAVESLAAAYLSYNFV